MSELDDAKFGTYQCCRKCLQWLPRTVDFFTSYRLPGTTRRILRRTCRECVKERARRIAEMDRGR